MFPRFFRFPGGLRGILAEKKRRQIPLTPFLMGMFQANYASLIRAKHSLQ